MESTYPGPVEEEKFDIPFTEACLEILDEICEAGSSRIISKSPYQRVDNEINEEYSMRIRW